MDFRTEWSSWILVILMMGISYFTNPWIADSIPLQLTQVIGLPFIAICISSIPVLIICFFIKQIPDIDYSIRLAFVYFLYLLVMHFIK